MPTQLTTPIQHPVTQATVDGWQLRVVRDNQTLGVRLDASTFTATVALRHADGSRESNAGLEIVLSEMEPAALAALRTWHTQVVSYLRTKGLLPPGTDTPDV